MNRCDRPFTDRRVVGFAQQVSPGWPRGVWAGFAYVWILFPIGAAGLFAFFVGQLRAEYLALEAGPSRAAIRPGDELWALSTRCQSAGPSQQLTPDVWRLAADRPSPEWRTSSLPDLLASGPKTWVVYVHGNRTTHADALAGGWDVYVRLVQPSHAPPLRFLIWSWPSDPMHGLLRDVRVKAARADAEAFLLLKWLEQLPPGSDVNFIGYSYGTRIICRAVHFWEPPVSGNDSRVTDPYLTLRAALLAPAMESDVLATGAPYGDAVLKFTHVLVLYNSCDPVLKHYGWVENCQKLRAMGYVGVEGALARDGIVWEYDAAPHIGRSHHSWYYFADTFLMQMTAKHFFQN